MDQLQQQLLGCLQQLKGSGKFASTGALDFVFPGLLVEDAGEIAFPVNKTQAQALIQSAHKAPFGKGRQTIYDNKVRSAWEIDTGKLSFSNPAWNKLMDKIIANVRTDLGLEGYAIAAHLYKLLIYEKGDFFLQHKDSEKEKGMFGTLIIGLPSKYTGGELVVHFEGMKETADFTQNSNLYTLNYAAFYADCDHEVKPLGSGYRVCLVYNLVQKKAGKKIELASLQTHAAKLAELLTRHQAVEEHKPCIVLLGHQYTPENFSHDALKLNDRAKAETLLLAAQKAGYYARLCLVTSYRSGAPAYDGYGEYGGGDDARMDEIYDESLSIEYWAASDLPVVRNLSFEEEDLVTSFPLDENEPLIKESTGFMGNYGPDLMHWYHYGAVIIWSPRVNARLLLSQDMSTQLHWISYFNHNQQVTDAEITAVESILSTGLYDNYYDSEDKSNFNAIPDWVIQRSNKRFFPDLKAPVLQLYFEKIDVAQWIKVFKFLPGKNTGKAFENLSENITLPVLEKLPSLLRKMTESETLPSLTIKQIQKLPHHFRALYTQPDQQVQGAALADLFWIARNIPLAKKWTEDMAEILTSQQERLYIHKILVPQLLAVKDHSELTKILLQSCRVYLQERADNQPQPPVDWSRPVPETNHYKKQWKLLEAFLNSPDERVFDYRKNQEERAALEFAINQEVTDLATETIKKGSPYTLRITKTLNAYHRQMKDWHEDIALLKKLVVK